MVKKKPIKLLFISTLVLSVIVTVLTLSVLAKYISAGRIIEDTTLEYFDVGYSVNGGQVESDDTIFMRVADYSNFNLTLNYEGDGKAFVRFLVEELWIAEDQNAGMQTVLTGANATAYSFIPEVTVIDNYGYLGPLSGTQDITVINDVNTNNAPANANYVKLSIKVEAVQYNRTMAFWGLDQAAITP